MLYLGEGKKYSGRSVCTLGSADPKIITLFLWFLKQVFAFNAAKVRCTVQCRADQNHETLESYWSTVTRIPRSQFYKTRIDPRTVGKPTQKQNYKGVLKIEYMSALPVLELEDLIDLVYNYIAQ